MESTLRELNQIYERGVTVEVLTALRSRLASAVSEYATECGASLTHVEVAIELALLRACGIYAVSPPGTRDRDLLFSIAADLPRLAISLNRGHHHLGLSLQTLRHEVATVFHADTLPPLRQLARQRRIMGPVSGCLPIEPDLLALLRDETQDVTQIARPLGRLLAGVLFETSDACTFPAVCCLVERLETSPTELLRDVLDVYRRFWQAWTGSDGQEARPSECLAKSELAMKSWLWHDGGTASDVEDADEQQSGSPAGEAEMESVRGSGSIVGVLVAEPNLSLEPGAELEESSRIQSLLDELRTVVRRADTVGRFGYHHIYAICRLHAPQDLEIIAERLHRNVRRRTDGADSHDVFIGGIAFPSQESFDSDHMLQMALLRLDAARRSNSGIDILGCDGSDEQVRRYHEAHVGQRVPSTPHLRDAR
ncbi:MAG: hypothetical protein NXI04_17275 [Planctomycetaceae bacterium]|nr:hypothetical protein [Planctomycetaceae bacterium]